MLTLIEDVWYQNSQTLTWIYLIHQSAITGVRRR
jgi:hypothetical protein